MPMWIHADSKKPACSHLRRDSMLALPLISVLLKNMSLRQMFTSCARASKCLVKLWCEKRSFSASTWPCRFALKMWFTKVDLKTKNSLRFLIKTGWFLEKRCYCLECKEWYRLHLYSPRVSVAGQCSLIKTGKVNSPLFFLYLSG